MGCVGSGKNFRGLGSVGCKILGWDGLDFKKMPISNSGTLRSSFKKF